MYSQTCKVKLIAKIWLSVLIYSTFEVFAEFVKVYLIWSNNNKIKILTLILVFKIFIRVWAKMVKNEKNEKLEIISFSSFISDDYEVKLYFCSSSFGFCFVQGEYKIQKMNIQLLDKNLDIFPHNLKTSLQIQMTVLKSRCHSKLILGLSAFQLL